MLVFSEREWLPFHLYLIDNLHYLEVPFGTMLFEFFFLH